MRIMDLYKVYIRNGYKKKIQSTKEILENRNIAAEIMLQTRTVDVARMDRKTER